MESTVHKILDHIDLQILDLLQTESQISNAELARRVNLSSPATHARVKRLEKEGFIKWQVAILNQEKLGFDLLCYVFINTHIHQMSQLDELEAELQKLPEIMECHCITGEYDYLLKVVIHDRNNLDQFIRKLNKLGISRILTNLSVREVKNSTILPIIQN